jgi:F0F1-type ATP synthase assembly protein I
MSNDANGEPPRRRPLIQGGGDGDGWAVVSYLIAGVGFWTFVGWLLDRWLETNVFVMIGVLIGFGGAFYLIIRRFGRS